MTQKEKWEDEWSNEWSKWQQEAIESGFAVEALFEDMQDTWEYVPDCRHTFDYRFKAILCLALLGNSIPTVANKLGNMDERYLNDLCSRNLYKVLRELMKNELRKNEKITWSNIKEKCRENGYLDPKQHLTIFAPAQLFQKRSNKSNKKQIQISASLTPEEIQKLRQIFPNLEILEVKEDDLEMQNDDYEDYRDRNIA